MLFSKLEIFKSYDTEERLDKVVRHSSISIFFQLKIKSELTKPKRIQFGSKCFN